MDYPACMYGGTHAGDSYAVRGEHGATVSGLCEEHKVRFWDVSHPPGFHLRTWQELADREKDSKNDEARITSLVKAGREAACGANSALTTQDTRMDCGGTPNREESGPDDSSTRAQNVVPLRGVSLKADNTGQVHNALKAGDANDLTVGLAQGPTSRRTHSVGEENSPPGQQRLEGTVRAAGAADESQFAPLDWWRGAGELVLEEWQHALLKAPFPPTLFQRNFDGEWYLPWVFCWERILEAFHPALPQLVPTQRPQIIGDAVCIHYVMLVNGCFAGEAWGEGQRRGGNRKMTYGNACESAKSEAIRRIGKTLGINLELWEPETIRALERSRAHVER